MALGHTNETMTSDCDDAYAYSIKKNGCLSVIRWGERFFGSTNHTLKLQDITIMKSSFLLCISLCAAKVLGEIPQNKGCFTNLTSATGGISCSDCLAGCSATTALCAPACARGWKVDGCAVRSRVISASRTSLINFLDVSCRSW